MKCEDCMQLQRLIAFEEDYNKFNGTNKDLLDLARNVARGVDVDVESVKRLVEEIDSK